MSDGNNEKMIRYLAILRVFGKHIARFCFSHSNSASDAQDLSQEILALVWEKLDGLKAGTDSPARVYGWLYKVMFTAFVRHLRQRPRIATVPLADAAPRRWTTSWPGSATATGTCCRCASTATPTPKSPSSPSAPRTASHSNFTEYTPN